MPIFDQGYQHYHGTPTSHAWRWMAIARRGVAPLLRRRGVRGLMFLSLIPIVLLVVFLALWGLLEQQSTWIEPLLAMMPFLNDLKAEAGSYRIMAWTFAFDVFLNVQTLTAMVLILLVGPELISQDLRFNAIPLYLSRPLTRLEYFAGKLGIIGFFLGSVMLAPAVLAYVLGIAFSLDLSVVRDTFRIFVMVIAYGLIVVLSAGTLMLALSSLVSSSRLATALWIGVWILTNMLSGALFGVSQDRRFEALSYTQNLQTLRTEMLGTRAAAKQLIEIVEKLQERSRVEAQKKAQLIALLSQKSAAKAQTGKRPVPPVTPARPGIRRQRRPNWIESLTKIPYPVSWALFILGGLFVVSAGLLSSRVRSLDRLR